MNSKFLESRIVKMLLFVTYLTLVVFSHSNAKGIPANVAPAKAEVAVVHKEVALSMYDAVLKQCPGIENSTLKEDQFFFDSCKDWSKINATHELNDSTQQDLLCLLYYDAFVSYCRELEQVAKHMPPLDFGSKLKEDWKIEMVCAESQPMFPKDKKFDHNVSSIIAGNKCFKFCLTEQTFKVNDFCKMAHIYANFNVSKLKMNIDRPNKMVYISPIRINNKTIELAAKTKENASKNQKSVLIPNKPAVDNSPSALVPQTKSDSELNTKNTQIDNKRNEDATKDEPTKTKPKETESNPVLPPVKSDKKEEPKQVVAFKPEVEVPKKDVQVEEEAIEHTEHKQGINEEKKEDNFEDQDSEQLEPIDIEDENNMQMPNVEKPENKEILEVKQSKEKPQMVEEAQVTAFDDQEELTGDSNFFSYFAFIMCLVIAGYIMYHNRQKVLAFALEGKKGRRTTRSRRPNSSNYHKLDSNLEEAISSSCTKSATNVIY